MPFEECKLLSPLKREELIAALKGGLPTDKVAALIEFLGPKDDSPIQDVYYKAAFGYHRDGDLEVDDNCVISQGDDNGAYVQMWKWISFTELDSELLANHKLFYCDDCNKLKPLDEKNVKASDADESYCTECVSLEEEAEEQEA